MKIIGLILYNFNKSINANVFKVLLLIKLTKIKIVKNDMMITNHRSTCRDQYFNQTNFFIDRQSRKIF